MNFERVKFDTLGAAAAVTAFDYVRMAINSLPPDKVASILAAPNNAKEQAVIAAVCSIAGLSWMVPVTMYLRRGRMARERANPQAKLKTEKTPKTRSLSPADIINQSLDEASRATDRMLGINGKK